MGSAVDVEQFVDRSVASFSDPCGHASFASPVLKYMVSPNVSLPRPRDGDYARRGAKRVRLCCVVSGILPADVQPSQLW